MEGSRTPRLLAALVALRLVSSWTLSGGHLSRNPASCAPRWGRVPHTLIARPAEPPTRPEGGDPADDRNASHPLPGCGDSSEGGEIGGSSTEPLPLPSTPPPPPPGGGAGPTVGPGVTGASSTGDPVMDYLERCAATQVDGESLARIEMKELGLPESQVRHAMAERLRLRRFREASARAAAASSGVGGVGGGGPLRGTTHVQEDGHRFSGPGDRGQRDARYNNDGREAAVWQRRSLPEVALAAELLRRAGAAGATAKDATTSFLRDRRVAERFAGGWAAARRKVGPRVAVARSRAAEAVSRLDAYLLDERTFPRLRSFLSDDPPPSLRPEQPRLEAAAPAAVPAGNASSFSSFSSSSSSSSSSPVAASAPVALGNLTALNAEIHEAEAAAQAAAVKLRRLWVQRRRALQAERQSAVGSGAWRRRMREPQEAAPHDAQAETAMAELGFSPAERAYVMDQRRQRRPPTPGTPPYAGLSEWWSKITGVRVD